MPANTPGGWPYILPTDHPKEYPAQSFQLATLLDTADNRTFGQSYIPVASAPIASGFDGSIPNIVVPFTAVPGDVWVVAFSSYIAAATGGVSFAPAIIGQSTTTVDFDLLPRDTFLPWYMEEGFLGGFVFSSPVKIPAGATGARRFAIHCVKASPGSRGLGVNGLPTMLTVTRLGPAA